MSSYTFRRFEESGARAAFPVMLRHLGRFLIGKSKVGCSVYEVLPPAMSKMPQRYFPEELRNTTAVAKGSGFQVTNPPAVGPDGVITIAMIKCANKLSEPTTAATRTRPPY